MRIFKGFLQSFELVHLKLNMADEEDNDFQVIWNNGRLSSFKRLFRKFSSKLLNHVGA